MNALFSFLRRFSGRLRKMTGRKLHLSFCRVDGKICWGSAAKKTLTGRLLYDLNAVGAQNSTS